MKLSAKAVATITRRVTRKVIAKIKDVQLAPGDEFTVSYGLHVVPDSEAKEGDFVLDRETGEITVKGPS